jgi:hypothetical protein
MSIVLKSRGLKLQEHPAPFNTCTGIALPFVTHIATLKYIRDLLLFIFRSKIRWSIPLCMKNISTFITVKTQLLNYLMTNIRQHVSTLWGSLSGLYKELKTI